VWRTIEAENKKAVQVKYLGGNPIIKQGKILS
jgi:hypothetical protein